MSGNITFSSTLTSGFDVVICQQHIGYNVCSEQQPVRHLQKNFITDSSFCSKSLEWSPYKTIKASLSRNDQENTCARIKMVLIDFHRYSTQTWTHAIYITVVIHALLLGSLPPEDDKNTIACS